MTGRGLSPEAAGPTLCIGEVLVEVVATTRGQGFLQAQPLVGPFPSGAPAIFADQCGRLGGDVGLIAAVGADDFGRLNLERLARDGVDISAISIDPSRPTGSAFVRYRPDGSRDFVFNITHSAASRLVWTPATQALVGRAGHLHVMGSALTIPSAGQIIDRAWRDIRARGGSLSLDPNLRKELALPQAMRRLFAALLAQADLLLPSGEELALAAGTGDEDAAVRALQDRGAGEVVLKRGEAGATAFAPDGQRLDARAFKVIEQDPTGAGDCFGAAYVTLRRKGRSPAQALEAACAAGARNVTCLGPMEGAATQQELALFMAATPRA